MKDEDISPDEAMVPVVAIGASAGGIEALCELVSRLEVGSGACYVVIQHLAPDKASMLHELLGARTTLPVEQIEHGAQVRPDSVVLVPPGMVAVIDGSHFELDPRDPAEPLFKPIDHFFTSLARNRGRDAYCVVLSGTGTDGTAGLTEIKGSGGYAIVQESEGARFPGMPDSAIATGMVDLVLPVREIGRRLQEILYDRAALRQDRSTNQLHAEIEDMLPRITERLAEVTGQDFSDYKPGTIVRRIERRMVLQRLRDVTRYAEILEADEEQATILAQEFLIGVTQFFRDPEVFAVLAEKAIVPILDGGSRSIRVWVPGCSTGEEPYSIAMLFIEEMRRRRDGRGLQVFGTDIDTHALLAARYGEFTAAAFEGMDAERRDTFFQFEGGAYRARPELREACVFAPHNLLQDPPFSRLDLISCRNMLIYLKPELQKKVFPRFHFSLKPEGMLLLGPSEGIAGNEELFKTVDKSSRLFQRNDEVKTLYSALGELPRRVQQSRGGLPQFQPKRPVAAIEPSREAMAERVFLREHASPFAVVSARGEVLYLSHQMTGLVRPAHGTPSTAIDTYLASALRVPVRTALSDAVKTGEPASVESIVVQSGDGQRIYDVLVSPMPGGGSDFLVTLREVRSTDPEAMGDAVQDRDVADRDILEQENIRLRRQLTATLNEHETSGQELKSTNEELMSMNEELQSSNEELETSREELQSINEELETVNAELRENNRQVVRANSDLKNLFESTDIAVLFLDRTFAVRSFTPATTAIFGIRTRDVGRPIFDLASRIDYPELRGDAARVDETLQTIEREVSVTATDETFLLRMRPYRTTDNRIDGYVLSFIDITIRKRSEETLRRNERDLARQYAELENLYDTTPIGLSLIDRRFRYIRINSKLAEINGLAVEDHIGRNFRDLLPDLAEELEQTYQQVFDTGEPMLGQAVQAKFAHSPGEVRHFITDLYPVYADGQVFAVGTCVREVTEEHRLIDQIAESEARMKRLFDASPVNITIYAGPDHVLVYQNPANERTLGGRDVIGQTLADALPEMSDQGLVERFDRAFAQGERTSTPEFSVDLEMPGEAEPRTIWFSQVIEPDRNAEGKVVGLISFAYDVTEQVAARQEIERQNAHQRLLLGELQHRVKNTLATIRAISKMLLAGAPDAGTFQKRLSTRLAAIARTHDLLTDADWTTVSFAQVAYTEARPYADTDAGRVVVTGDRLVLSSRQATSLGMAIHELMTNAAKYGALSNEDGHVEIAVEVADGRAVIRWIERDGPPVVPPTEEQKGFGTVVLERVLASDLRAEVEADYAAEGLRYRIAFDTAQP